jgi:hypothetical protein
VSYWAGKRISEIRFNRALTDREQEEFDSYDAEARRLDGAEAERVRKSMSSLMKQHNENISALRDLADRLGES